MKEYLHETLSQVLHTNTDSVGSDFSLRNQDMSYQVSLVSFACAPRDHHVIFVETEEGGSGQIFHIKGRIQQGMTYETKPVRKPEESTTFITRELLGTVTMENYPRIDSVCKQFPPPAKQLDQAHRINPSVPLRQCQEWTQETLQALKNEGILQQKLTPRQS